MPQLQSVVLTDRSTPTPNNWTFVPRDIVQNVGTVVFSSGVPIGDSRMTVSTKRNSSGKYKSEIRMVIPVVQNQTINGVVSPVVVRTAYVNLDFTFDQTSTEDERNSVVGLLQSALGSSKTLVNDAVVKLEGVY